MTMNIQGRSRDLGSLTELTFHVPELQQRPAIGGGCCALPAEFLIEQVLMEVEQVREVAVSDKDSLIRVWAIKDDTDLVKELKNRIEGLGYRGSGIGSSDILGPGDYWNFC